MRESKGGKGKGIHLNSLSMKAFYGEVMGSILKNQPGE